MKNEQNQNKQWEFCLDSLADLVSRSQDLGAGLSAQDDISILAEPVNAGQLIVPNSLAIHPMEGCDGDKNGRPGKLTLRRYSRFAAGGAGLLWAEAIAVTPEARANPRQLWLCQETKDQFKAMVYMMKTVAAESMGRDHKPVIIAQLTHSGRYSKPDGKPTPLIPVRDPYRDPLTPEPVPSKNRTSRIPEDWPVLTDEYLDQLQLKFTEAARIAFECGFDAVDIKSCHGYLINELLACHTRKGKYGGSFENRTRFLLEVIDKIRNEHGPDKPITLRLGLYDRIPYPYGWAVDKDDYTKPDLTEPKKLIKLLKDRGVRLINTTIANPYYNPHVGRPFNVPVKGGYSEPEHPIIGIHRLVELTGMVQQENPDMAFVGTGYSWLRHLMANVAAASKANGLAKIIGAGRMALAYPDFAKDIIQNGKMDIKKVCVGCSACTQIMRDGGTAGCVVRDSKIYGPIFRHGRMSDKDNLLRLAGSCSQCRDATCMHACPAHIDIPAFIKAFLDGDEKEAYEIIRRRNVLPEICAWLCPVEHQCQGGCLQNFIGDGPLPIAEIQRHVAEVANREGWSRLRYPAEASGKNIAIIGAGPAGLAAAAVLIEAGHRITIYDKSLEFGGMIKSVIPTARQCDALRNEISSIFKDIPEDRMVLNLGCEVNKSFTLDHIMSQGFDAVFIGMGLSQSISSGDSMEGLYNALGFLKVIKDNPGMLKLKGKKVAVIGGGNTAMDAAISAKQAGARDVYIIYRRSFEEMPAWSSERDKAINEGIHFLVLTQQLSYESVDGKLTGIRVCPVQLGSPDASGRRKPEPIEMAAYTLGMDAVVESIGQKTMGNLDDVLQGVAVIDGLIKISEGTHKTTRQKVFAGGDLVHGTSTVVAAVSDGMAAAIEINETINGNHTE